VYAQYDGLGRRVEKGTQQGQGNVAWTQYTYQQLSLDVLAEFPQTGPPRVNYLYRGRAGSIVTMEACPESGRREQQGGGTGKEYWFAQDGLVSTAAVTKQDGQSAHDYFYAPYGGIIDDNGHPEDSSNASAGTFDYAQDKLSAGWTDPHPSWLRACNHYLLTGKEWDEESRLLLFDSPFGRLRTRLRASFGARYYPRHSLRLMP